MPKIETLYAYLSENSPDDEGLVGMKVGDTWVAMVGADMQRMESLKDIAQDMARATGKKIILAKFSTKTVLETIEPEQHDH